MPRSSCTVFYFTRSRFGAMLILLHLVSSNLERSAQVRFVNIVNTDVSAQAAIRTLLLPFASRVNIVDRIYHAGTRRARRSFVASLTHRMRGPVDSSSSADHADSGRSIVGTANPVIIYPAISFARIFTRSLTALGNTNGLFAVRVRNLSAISRPGAIAQMHARCYACLIYYAFSAFRLGGEFNSPAATMPSKRVILRDDRMLDSQAAAIHSARAAYTVHPGCSRMEIRNCPREYLEKGGVFRPPFVRFLGE